VCRAKSGVSKRENKNFVGKESEIIVSAPVFKEKK
jgi:hypothetical protein